MPEQMLRPRIAVSPAPTSAGRQTKALAGGISLGVAGLALAAYRQHEDRIDLGHITIQGHIPMRTTPNYQFALGIRHRMADQWVLHQNIQGSNDFANALTGVRHFMAGQMIEDALEILRELGCQLDAGHLQRASLRATGRFIALPAMRASR